MLKATYIRSYRAKGSGTNTHVYIVSGTPKELEQYETVQGDYFRVNTEDPIPANNGKPLFFSQNLVVDKPGQSAELRLNRAGDRFNIIEDQQRAEFKNMQKEAMALAFQRQLFGGSTSSATGQTLTDNEPDDQDAAQGAAAGKAGKNANKAAETELDK